MNRLNIIATSTVAPAVSTPALALKPAIGNSTVAPVVSTPALALKPAIGNSTVAPAVSTPALALKPAIGNSTVAPAVSTPALALKPAISCSRIPAQSIPKWADYVVSAVKYNNAHTHIDKLRVHEDNGNTISMPPREFTRADIIAMIAKKTFVTISLNSEGKWLEGQRIYIIKINGNEFLKTVDNKKTEDNLENLPEF